MPICLVVCSSPSILRSICRETDAQGWVVRWATYSDYHFEEGVSLTAADELSRWQKYAWGVSEIVFYPIKSWFRKGVFTPLFKGLLSSNIPTHSKWGIQAYMFSYYGQSISAFQHIVGERRSLRMPKWEVVWGEELM